MTFDEIEATPIAATAAAVPSEDDSVDSAQKAEGEGKEDNHLKVHERLITRKPTPYNPFKQAPMSYLTR